VSLAGPYILVNAVIGQVPLSLIPQPSALATFSMFTSDTFVTARSIPP
jgi:hypothetical protein